MQRPALIFLGLLLGPPMAQAFDFDITQEGAEMIEIPVGEGIETVGVDVAAVVADLHAQQWTTAEIEAAFPSGLSVNGLEYRSISASLRGWIKAGERGAISAAGVRSDPPRYLERNERSDYTDWQVWSMHPERFFFTDETATLITVIPESPGSPGQVLVTWRQITNDNDADRGEPLLSNWLQAQFTHRGDGDADIEFRYQICDWVYHIESRPHEEARSFLGFHIEGEDGQAWLSDFSFSPEMKLLCALSNQGSPDNPARRGIWTYQLRNGRMSGCGLPDSDPPAGVNRCNDGNSVAGDGCSVDCWVEEDVDMDGQFEPPYEGALDPLEVYDDCLFDACIGDEDRDGDGIPNGMDNCWLLANPLQKNYDGDNFGDVCDIGIDGDGIPPEFDSCPFYVNLAWRQDIEGRPDVMPDLDNDGIGDQCDDDDDADEVLDCGTDRICSPARDGVDNDADTVVDEGGEISINARWDGVDNDRDGFVDEASEADLQGAAVWSGPDNDDSEDNCRQVWNPEQGDLDFDDLGNACDPDLDGDGLSNCGLDGICPLDRDFIDNNRNGQVDEPGECSEPNSCPLERDGIDNDGDGYVDEGPIFRVEPGIGVELIDTSAERHAERPEYPGPDEGEDNCPGARNEDQLDTDGDGIGDRCQDSDGDGRIDIWDNCPMTASADQADTDRDQIGDVCDPDLDGDGTANEIDNCPRRFNIDQEDIDGDGIGNVCDEDPDGDGVIRADDNCDLTENPDQTDTDDDGYGDACDKDDDGDRIWDKNDNCPLIPNRNQVNTDEDQMGDACDDDDDNDGILDKDDPCPSHLGVSNLDTDEDGLGDECTDVDDDNDGYEDAEDNCPRIANPDQSNFDGDKLGDICEDSDGDGLLDAKDNCPGLVNPDQTDFDKDGKGDVCDDFKIEKINECREHTSLGLRGKCNGPTHKIGCQGADASSNALWALLLLPVAWKRRR